MTILSSSVTSSKLNEWGWSGEPGIESRTFPSQAKAVTEEIILNENLTTLPRTTKKRITRRNIKTVPGVPKRFFETKLSMLLRLMLRAVDRRGPITHLVLCLVASWYYKKVLWYWPPDLPLNRTDSPRAKEMTESNSCSDM